MKKLGYVTVGLIMGIILSLSTIASANQDSIKIVVNGVAIPSDPAPFIQNDRTFVPIRFVAEALKVPVKYDGNTKTVYVGEIPKALNLFTDIPVLENKEGIQRFKDVPFAGKPLSGWFINGEAVTFQLGKQYKTLTLKMGREDGGTYPPALSLTNLDTQATITDGSISLKNGEVKEYTFDVSDVNTLEMFSNEYGYFDASLELK